jgi:hypothetical protein
MNGDVGSNGCNYIWCAVKHGRMLILKMLLSTNLKVNVHTVMYNPILLAVDLQKIDMLKMMLEYLDHRYIAPECVHSAIKANRIDILRLFDLTDSRIVAHKAELLLECTSGEMLAYVQDSVRYTLS